MGNAQNEKQGRNAAPFNEFSIIGPILILMKEEKKRKMKREKE